MNAKQLPVFLAVMRHRSIGRAAASVGITQAAASRIIQRLEVEVGAELFERYSSGVVPTVFAQTLLPFAEEILSNSRTALEEIAALRGSGVSIARVGAVASIASSVLPGAIDQLLKHWPNLSVQLLEAVDDQLSSALANGEIDIAIAGRMDHSEVPFSRRDSFSDTLVVIARRGHTLTRRRSVDLEELTGFRWVLPPQAVLPMQEFVRRFQSHDLEPPKATVETRSVSAIRALVASTDMLSWQPRAIHALGGKDDPIEEIHCDALTWTRVFHVFKRKRGLLAPAAVKLINEMRSMGGVRLA